MQGPITLANDNLVVGVSTRGGALTLGETRDGRPFLRGAAPGASDVRDMACFPLVPVANRVAVREIEHAGGRHAFHPNTDDPCYLHGDGWLADWTVEEQTPTMVRLSFDKPAAAEGPHLYRAEEQVEIKGHSLCVTLSVVNRGCVDMPFGLGLHPYFPRAGAKVTFPSTAWWTEREGHLPGERLQPPAEADFSTERTLPPRWLNNAYEGWSGIATVRWPDKRLALRLTADPIFGTLMVYAPDSDQSFFCLEPMSHLPNALGLFGAPGMHILAPGETLSGRVTFEVFTEEQEP